MTRLSTRFLFLATIVTVSCLSNRVYAQSICDLVLTAEPGIVQMPGSSRYENSQQEYFSLIQRDVSPACIVQPSSSEEVAGIVKVAIENDIPFAIHSGGHMWLPEASNIGGNGFTLDLVDIKTYELADDKKSVKIGSGWRWGSVFDKLAEEGLHAIGGRDKDVGVGGFLLGGGLSFLSYVHGIGSHNVIDYEVVLSSGDIVHANESENPDLFWALKYGSTNYGIVTHYTINTWPIESQFWSGNRVFAYEHLPTLLNNFADFVREANNHTSPCFNQIVISRLNGTNKIDSHLCFRGPEVEPELYRTYPGNVPVLEDAMAVKNLSAALADVTDFSARTRGFAMTLSFNLNDPIFIKDEYEKGIEIFAAVEDVPGFGFSTSIQPTPKSYFQGPDSPVKVRGKEDFMVMLMRFSWLNKNDDKRVQKVAHKWLKWAKAESARRGILYPFTYLNYASEEQDVYGETLTKENLSKMLEIQAKYDDGLKLSTLVPGGIKLPK